MQFENESQLSVRCFRCGCFGHRGLQCENYLANRISQNSNTGGMLEKCWICGCLGHIAVECKEKTVTCFSCGERGHKQEDCSSPMANCWNCGQRGHIKKDCPVKRNLGMCFYCHEVGHHSKDCSKKVCYICGGKDHLWTRCPWKGARGFQPSTNGYVRPMRHPQSGQDYQNSFQHKHFSEQLLLDTQFYQSFGHQEHVPRCIRPKSVPLSLEQERTAAQERPLPLRMNSDPAGYSTSFGSSLEHSRMSQSINDFELIRNQSYLSAIAPHVRSVGLSLKSDQDGSGFSMADVFSRSDESTMKVTDSENDSLMPSLNGNYRGLIQSVIADWKKDIYREPEHGVPICNSSEDNELRAEMNNPKARTLLSTQGEKQELKNEYDSVDLPSSRDNRYCEENTMSDIGDEQTVPVQDQQPTQKTQTNPDVLEGRDKAVADRKVEKVSNGINTKSLTPTITSTLTKDSNISISESVMSNRKQKDGRAQTDEGFVPEFKAKKLNSLELSNAKFLDEIGTKGNEVNEELKRVREQLAEAKVKLDEKAEQLDKTQKMVEALKKVIFLDSLVKKKFCQKKNEQSTRGEDVSNRCPSCIQIMKNLESCKECMM